MPRSSPPKPFPHELKPARKLLEAWRTAPKRSRAIPDDVWTAVVDASRTVSAYRISRSLRLDYMSVKKRVEKQACSTPIKRAPKKLRGKFVEVGPVELMPQRACVVELCGAGDLKLRVELSAFDPAALATFAHQVLRAQS